MLASRARARCAYARIARAHVRAPTASTSITRGDLYVYDGNSHLGLAPAAVRIVRVRSRAVRAEPLALAQRTLEQLPGVAILEYTLDGAAQRTQRRQLLTLRLQYEPRGSSREPVLVHALGARQIVYRRLREPAPAWRVVHDCFL